MLFTKRLREPIKRGEITCSVRIWKKPHVRVGHRYALPPGSIVVDDTGGEHRFCSVLDPRRQHLSREVEPEDDRGVAHVRSPEPVGVALKRRSELGQLERAHHAPAIVGMQVRGRVGITPRQDRMGTLGAEAVVDALPVRA